jgi:Fic family protein
LIQSRVLLFKHEFGGEISDDDALAILRKVYEHLFEDYLRSIESRDISAIFNLRKLKAWMAILGQRFTGDRQTKLTIVRGSSGISTVTGQAGSLIGLTIDHKMRPDQVSGGLGHLFAGLNKVSASTPLESLGSLRHYFEHIHPFMDFPKTTAFLLLDFCLLRMEKNPPLSGIGESQILHYYSGL